MSISRPSLNALLGRARVGDAPAREQLRTTLEPQMARIVRCALRSPDFPHPLAAQARAEVRQLQAHGDAGQPPSPDRLIAAAARRLCEMVDANARQQTQRQRWSADTVAVA